MAQRPDITSIELLRRLAPYAVQTLTLSVVRQTVVIENIAFTAKRRDAVLRKIRKEFRLTPV